MMARCKLNPCCGQTMPGKCNPPPQFKPGESYEGYVRRTNPLLSDGAALINSRQFGSVNEVEPEDAGSDAEGRA